MDAITAFLQGDLEEEIYVQQPDGFRDGSNRVCKLIKAMYGLKQSGRQWNNNLQISNYVDSPMRIGLRTSIKGVLVPVMFSG